MEAFCAVGVDSGLGWGSAPVPLFDAFPSFTSVSPTVLQAATLQPPLVDSRSKSSSTVLLPSGSHRVSPTSLNTGWHRAHVGPNSGNLCQCVLPLLGLESYNQEAPGRYGYVRLRQSLPIRPGAVNPLTAPGQSCPCYTWAKASRSLFSCSSGRLVEMISKS